MQIVKVFVLIHHMKVLVFMYGELLPYANNTQILIAPWLACHINTMVSKELWSIDLLRGFPPVCVSRILRQLCPQCHKEPGSPVPSVTSNLFLCKSRRGCWVCCQECVCVCVLTPMVCQCKVKRVAWVVKACCLLMSRPVECLRTQMGFLSVGLFFRLSLSVFEEMWKPKLEWTGILLNEGRLEAFTQDVLNRT